MHCGAVRDSEGGLGRSKSSHEKSWWRLSPSHCLRGGSRARLWYGHMQSACLSCLLSLSPSILAPASLRPRMPATNRAGDTGYYHSSSCGGSRCCGKGIVCSPHGRKEGRKGRTYERMTSAFVGEEDNGDGRQMPQAEREDEWSPRIKFATATAKVYLSPPRLGTQSPPQNENYA